MARKSAPAPKVRPVSPLSNATRVPLGEMLNSLGQASGLSKKDQQSKLIELSMGPKTPVR